MGRLLSVILGDSVAGLRLRALLLAYLLTGRRRTELLNLRWQDLDLEGEKDALAAGSAAGRLLPEAVRGPLQQTIRWPPRSDGRPRAQRRGMASAIS